MAPRQGKMPTCHFQNAVSCNLEWKCHVPLSSEPGTHDGTAGGGLEMMPIAKPSMIAVGTCRRGTEPSPSILPLSSEPGTHTTVKVRLWPRREPFVKQTSLKPFKWVPARSAADKERVWKQIRKATRTLPLSRSLSLSLSLSRSPFRSPSHSSPERVFRYKL